MSEMNNHNVVVEAQEEFDEFTKQLGITEEMINDPEFEFVEQKNNG